MNIKLQIDSDLKTALLSGKKEMVTTLRGLKSVILDSEIATGKRENGLAEVEVISLLMKEVKKRHESIALYEKAGAEDKANIEKREISYIEKYLPAMMNEEDIKKLVDKVINSIGDVTVQQMGQIIGMVKAQAGPTADGSIIAQTVKARLAK